MKKIEIQKPVIFGQKTMSKKLKRKTKQLKVALLDVILAATTIDIFRKEIGNVFHIALGAIF